MMLTAELGLDVGDGWMGSAALVGAWVIEQPNIQASQSL